MKVSLKLNETGSIFRCSNRRETHDVEKLWGERRRRERSEKEVEIQLSR